MTDAALDALIFWYSQRDRCPCCGGELRQEITRESCRVCLWRRSLGVVAEDHHDVRQDVLDLLVEVQRWRRKPLATAGATKEDKSDGDCSEQGDGGGAPGFAAECAAIPGGMLQRSSVVEADPDGGGPGADH
jgi:hypothetical protein